MSTEECRKWVVYIPPLTCTSNRTMERMITRPIAFVHVHLSDHLSLARFYRIFFRQSLRISTSHEYFVTSYRSPIVKRALAKLLLLIL